MAGNFSNCKLFQIDDGWNNGTYYGDWSWDTTNFPSGGAYLASQITTAGMTPGLWVSPWMVTEDSNIFVEHPDWLLNTTSTSWYNFTGGYPVRTQYFLDPSNPDVVDFLYNTFSELYSQGWRYFKLDFNPFELFKSGAYLQYQVMSWEEMLRSNMGAIRAAAPDSFIMQSIWSFPTDPSFSQSQMNRYATDISFLKSSPFNTYNYAASVYNWVSQFYTNDTILADSDYITSSGNHYMGNFPDWFSHLWMSYIFVTGSPMIIGQEFDSAKYNATSVNWLQRITRYPSTGQRGIVAEVSYNDYFTPPRIFGINDTPLSNRTDGVGEGFILIVNPDTTLSKTINVNLTNIGFSGSSYVLQNFWDPTDARIVSNIFSETLPAKSSKSYVLHAEGSPAVMYTDDDIFMNTATATNLNFKLTGSGPSTLVIYAANNGNASSIKIDNVSAIWTYDTTTKIVSTTITLTGNNEIAVEWKAH